MLKYFQLNSWECCINCVGREWVSEWIVNSAVNSLSRRHNRKETGRSCRTSVFCKSPRLRRGLCANGDNECVNYPTNMMSSFRIVSIFANCDDAAPNRSTDRITSWPCVLVSSFILGDATGTLSGTKYNSSPTTNLWHYSYRNIEKLARFCRSPNQIFTFLSCLRPPLSGTYIFPPTSSQSLPGN